MADNKPGEGDPQEGADAGNRPDPEGDAPKPELNAEEYAKLKADYDKLQSEHGRQAEELGTMRALYEDMSERIAQFPQVPPQGQQQQAGAAPQTDYSQLMYQDPNAFAQQLEQRLTEKAQQIVEQRQKQMEDQQRQGAQVVKEIEDFVGENPDLGTPFAKDLFLLNAQRIVQAQGKIPDTATGRKKVLSDAAEQTRKSGEGYFEYRKQVQEQAAAEAAAASTGGGQSPGAPGGAPATADLEDPFAVVRDQRKRFQQRITGQPETS